MFSNPVPIQEAVKIDPEVAAFVAKIASGEVSLCAPAGIPIVTDEVLTPEEWDDKFEGLVNELQN